MAQFKKKSFEELNTLFEYYTPTDVLTKLADFMSADELEKFLEYVKEEFGL